MIRKSLTFLSILSLILHCACSPRPDQKTSEKDIQIIPKPNNISLTGSPFVFDQNTTLVIPDDKDAPLAEILRSPFQKAAGIDLKVSQQKPENNYILLAEKPELSSENYELDINDQLITIKAADYNGFVYGLETLLQLLPAEINIQTLSESNWTVPGVSIKDGPRFEWRGFMLDVSRHFFEKEYVMQTIDQLAFHKMNKLHLHLVDDQGWRIEIKKYPKLTEVGAWRVDQEDLAWNSRRNPEIGEKATYGGFFTQEDLKEIVAYAGKMGIDVIPEIEMPAHVMSAIAAYPELSCQGEPIMVPSGGVWPITDIFCPGKETTFDFLENVLDEVIEIFPYEYVHLGGDEATKTNWETCPHCQKRVKEEGLKDVAELQSYFMIRMEKYLTSKGRKMIGWDEIMEGGLGPEASVMSWRGFEYGFEASAQGHDVIMTPTSHCYFDYYQGPQDTEPEAFNAYTPLSQVYQFNPAPDSLTDLQKQHILGGQANLWSEFINTTDHSEYMIYPRLDALSESLWSTESNKDWMDFTTRLQAQFSRYEFAGINYAKSAYAVTGSDSVSISEKKIFVELETEMPDTDIRYTLDGSVPQSQSTAYTQPITLTESTTIKAVVFKNGDAFGSPLEKSFYFHNAFGKEVKYLSEPHKAYTGNPFTLVDGSNGSLDFHDGKWQGWLNQDMEIIIDLESTREVSQVKVSSLESQGSGIYFPSGAQVLLSTDGSSFHEVASLDNPAAKNATRSIKVFDLEFEKENAQFVKVIVTNPGSFIFLDEVQIY